MNRQIFFIFKFGMVHALGLNNIKMMKQLNSFRAERLLHVLKTTESLLFQELGKLELSSTENSVFQ